MPGSSEENIRVNRSETFYESSVILCSAAKHCGKCSLDKKDPLSYRKLYANDRCNVLWTDLGRVINGDIRKIKIKSCFKRLMIRF